jgi:hypothetical protein
VLLTPLAVLLLPLAVAPSPTAVAPAPDASAWQFALDNRSVFATLPELHPAIAEFAPIARVAIAQPANSAKRRLLRIDDMTAPNADASARTVAAVLPPEARCARERIGADHNLRPRHVM